MATPLLISYGKLVGTEYAFCIHVCLSLGKEYIVEERSVGRRHCHPMGLRKRKAGIRYLVDYFDILLCLRISIKLPQSRNLQCDDMKRLHIFILLHCILKDDQIFQIQTHLVN